MKKEVIILTPCSEYLSFLLKIIKEKYSNLDLSFFPYKVEESEIQAIFRSMLENSPSSLPIVLPPIYINDCVHLVTLNISFINSRNNPGVFIKGLKYLNCNPASKLSGALFMDRAMQCSQDKWPHNLKYSKQDWNSVTALHFLDSLCKDRQGNPINRGTIFIPTTCKAKDLYWKIRNKEISDINNFIPFATTNHLLALEAARGKFIASQYMCIYCKGTLGLNNCPRCKDKFSFLTGKRNVFGKDFITPKKVLDEFSKLSFNLDYII